jgi:hypothetical protein
MHDWMQAVPIVSVVLLLWLVFVAMSIHSQLERISRFIEDRFAEPEEDDDARLDELKGN